LTHGSGIRDEQAVSYFRELRTHFCGLKYFDADPGWKKFGSEIRNGKNSDPGSGMEKIRIRDKHPGTITLQTRCKTPHKKNKMQNTPKMDTKSETEKPAHLLVGEGVRDGQDAL
jgi:hypothetical protein